MEAGEPWAVDASRRGKAKPDIFSLKPSNDGYYIAYLTPHWAKRIVDFVKVEKARPVLKSEYPNLDLFFYKGKYGYIVSDGRTGLNMWSTIARIPLVVAESETRKMVRKKGVGQIKFLIEHFVEGNGISPRYGGSAHVETDLTK